MVSGALGTKFQIEYIPNSNEYIYRVFLNDAIFFYKHDQS